MKKIIVFLLAMTMVFSVLTLASCAEKKTETNKGGNDNVDDGRIWLDNLPDDIDLQGETVTFVGHGSSTAERFGLEGTFVDEPNGDTVADAMHESTENVKNRFNVEIECITASDLLTKSITSQLMAGDSDYDVLVGYAYYDFSLASSGYVLDVNSLGDLGAGDIIDTNQPYWAKNYIESASYKGKSYWLVGDISIETLGCMYVTFVNDALYQKTCNETFGNIYNVVNNNEWTIDKLSEMSALCYSDLNGNDKADDPDVYGWATHWIHAVDGITIGLGIEYTERLADGTIALTISSNPRNIDLLQKLYNFKSLATSHTYSQEIATINAFKEDRVMFMVNTLRHAEINLRDMETDYYILPVPKLDSAQENYRTGIHDQCAIFGISYASEKVYESAVVLEALCAEHSRLVRPKYYDEALKYKYTRDDASADMIDIVRDSVFTDFALCWAKDLGGITHTIRNLAPNPQSTLKKGLPTWTKSLETLTQNFENAQ